MGYLEMHPEDFQAMELLGGHEDAWEPPAVLLTNAGAEWWVLGMIQWNNDQRDRKGNDNGRVS